MSKNICSMQPLKECMAATAGWHKRSQYGQKMNGRSLQIKWHTTLKNGRLQVLFLKNIYCFYKWSHNDFPQTNISFKFSRINHKPLVMIWMYINTVSLTYESLQVLPWNNDTTIEKKDSCNRCRQITDLIQYIHSWNQGQKREFMFPEFGWVKFFYHLPPALSKLYQNIYFLFQKEKRKNTDTHTNKKEKKLKNTSWL